MLLSTVNFITKQVPDLLIKQYIQRCTQRAAGGETCSAETSVCCFFLNWIQWNVILKSLTSILVKNQPVYFLSTILLVYCVMCLKTIKGHTDQDYYKDPAVKG